MIEADGDLHRELCLEGGGDRGSGDAVLLEHPLVGSRGAVAVDPDARPGPAAPPEGDAGLERHAGHPCGRTDCDVVGALALEELPAGHRDDADVRVHLLGAFERHVHLRAGRDHDRVGFAFAALPERVCPAERAVGGAELGAVEGRQLLPAQGECNGAVLALDSDPPRHRRLVRVGGADVPEVRDRAQGHDGARPAGASARPRRPRPSRASRPTRTEAPSAAESRTDGRM